MALRFCMNCIKFVFYAISILLSGSTVYACDLATTNLADGNTLTINTSQPCNGIQTSPPASGAAVGISITNSGTINGVSSNDGGAVATDVASGIQFSQNAISILPNSSVATLRNTSNGTISAIASSSASTSDINGTNGIIVYQGGNLSHLINNGTFVSSSTQPVSNTSVSNIANMGSIGVIDNIGSFSANADTSASAVSIFNTCASYLTTFTATATSCYVGGARTATIGTINNWGTIVAQFGLLTQQAASVNAINNYGSINSTFDFSSDSAIFNGSGGQIGSIYNAQGASIRSYDSTIINTDANIDNITNGGTIQSIGVNSTPAFYYNSFTAGISNYGNIGSVVNTGLINALASFGYGIGNSIGGAIGAITNTGIINGGSGIGIYNGGVITTLNNGQGGNSLTPAKTALTYSGVLPLNYNVIINSTSNYGQLAVMPSSTGSMAFGIYTGSSITTKLYTGVLQGLTTSSVGSTRTGSYSGRNWTLALESGSSTIWDLIFTGASTEDTQTSLFNTYSALQGAFNLQISIINNGLNYDCSLFDAHGLCISTGGRYTNTNTPTGDSTGALVIGGYRVNDNVRVGLYLDQGVSSSTPTGINLKQHNPLFGAFGVWQARQDGLGAQVKVAAGYNDSDMTVNRAVVGSSETGSGSTSLTSQAVSVVGSYGVEMQGSWIASPYVGIRYTDVKAGGYAEASSSSVTAPLSYSSLSQSTTSLLAGIRWFGKLTERVSLNASVGVEQDVSNNNSSYTATGVDGLTPIVFNTDINKTRPVASIGTSVAIDKRQQLAFSVMYREEAFSKSSTTSAYGTYTIGF